MSYVNTEPLPEVIICASGFPVEGGTYSLSCQITSSETIPSSMAWIKPAHVALLTSGDGIKINGPVRSGNTSTLTLTFHPLQAQQKGNYTCLQTDMNITVKSNHFTVNESDKVSNEFTTKHPKSSYQCCVITVMEVLQLFAGLLMILSAYATIRCVSLNVLPTHICNHPIQATGNGSCKVITMVTPTTTYILQQCTEVVQTENSVQETNPNASAKIVIGQFNTLYLPK